MESGWLTIDVQREVCRCLQKGPGREGGIGQIFAETRIRQEWGEDRVTTRCIFIRVSLPKEETSVFSPLLSTGKVLSSWLAAGHLAAGNGGNVRFRERLRPNRAAGVIRALRLPPQSKSRTRTTTTTRRIALS
jgi:hypothetical protein